MPAIPLLFIGNSYTFTNELNVVVEKLLEEGLPEYAETDTLRLAEAGYTWEAHVARAATDPTWQDALITGTTPWQYGILQEQSQIPGFYGEDPYWETSAASAGQLNDWLAARGAGTLLLMTWGRRDGDVDNLWLYPDFPTMQAQLTEGYLAYQSRLSTPERPVWIAPAGLAYEAVYDAAITMGEIPQEGLFGRLYVSDGSHPSPAGTFMIACVIYSSITGQDPTRLTIPNSVDPTDGAILAQVASDVVFDGGLRYPWSPSDPQDTGDTGSTIDTNSPHDTAQDADTNAPDSKDSPTDSNGTPQINPTADSDCGCSNGEALLFGFLSLGLARRRTSRNS